MDFWSTVLVLLRRWYVAVPVLLLSLGSTSMAAQSVPTYYTSISVLVLTTPVHGGTLFGGVTSSTSITNPMLNFEAGLSTSGGILVQAINSPTAVEQLTASTGSDTSYQITNGSTNLELSAGSPFLYIQGKSTSEVKARDIVVRVAQRVRDELAAEQKALGAPPTTYITVTELVPPTTPQPQRGGTLRALIAALMISVVTSLTVTFGAESVFEARRRRRSRHPDVGAVVYGIETNGSVAIPVPNHAALKDGSGPGAGGDLASNGHLAQSFPAERTEG